MDDKSMNRYEKQLYTVFKTFDVDNEEALDKSAVRELCDALQLEDRGAALVKTLFERQSERVTFTQFRNGFLAVLGSAAGDPTAASSVPVPLSQTDSILQSESPPQHSDDDSSGREVAPKFVFGSKKYGRRSRPPRATTATTESPSPRSSSASRLDTNDKKERQRMRCRRSASAMESRNEIAVQDGDENLSTEPFEHDRRIDRNQALELCRGLHMDSIDHGLVERIFEDTGTTDTTVGEFFDRLNTSLATTIEETNREARVLATDSDTSIKLGDGDMGCGVPTELVLEAWEHAGIQQPRCLLTELGFGATSLRPPELERALDDELRALPDPLPDNGNARSILLAASLAVSRLRLELTRRRAELITAERDKLRNDVAEANKRAGLLAQEVDESQARIEAELKATVRRAEARQAEAARQTAAEQAAERERATAIRNRLEAEVARRSDAEARLREEISKLRKRVEELESIRSIAEQNAIESERERTHLAAELRSVLARNAAEDVQRGESGELAARLYELRAENKQLRDRNDELCAALETSVRSVTPNVCNTVRGGDLSAELNSLLMQDRSEECDSAPMSIDQRILGHVEALMKLRQICDSINTITLTDANACSSCGTVYNSIMQLQEHVRDLSETLVVSETPHVHISTQTDQVNDTEAIHDLQDQLRKNDDEKQKLTSLVKDMESSLDQMKVEYEKCEEYWSHKLEEERDTYNEEQRLGDERLAELIAKIGEYERQFASASTSLPTIDERYSLEVQFTDLEEEFARYRRDKDAELQASAAECARLVERAEALERRLTAAEAERANSPGPRRRSRDYHNPAYCAPRPSEAQDVPREATRLTEAGARHVMEVRELRARCARAEAAVRRLHARLAAADVLVKELYVENCQLAHRRPL